MNQPRLVFSLALLAPSVFAQEHTIAIKPQGDTPTRYTIESSSKVETSRKMLINGEEREFGRGGGGAGGGGRGAAPQGPTSAKSKLVFVDGGAWRQYETVEAKVTRPGWDGESDEQTVTGELQGKKISLAGEPAVMEGEKSTPLAANSARGLPRKIDLSGLAPNKPLALNGTYEIGNPFKAAVVSLSHPVRAARPEGGEAAAAGGGGRRNRGGGEGGDAAGGGGRRNRGGGEGGDAAGGGGEARRGRGPGGMGARGGIDFNVLQVISSEGATPKLVGKLTKVENGVATIEISGDVVGEGAPDKLGITGIGGMMGRGRRGGEGGAGGDAAPQGESKAKIKFAVTGAMTVDVASGALQSLKLAGKIDASEHSKMSREGQDGETMEIESDATRKGEFNISVTTGAAK